MILCFMADSLLVNKKTNCSIDIPSIGFVPAMEILSEKIIRYSNEKADNILS